MVVRLVLWSIADAPATLDELRRELGAQPPRPPGLLFEAWMSDAATERFGAVSVWESREAADRHLPTRARELIGKDPEIAEEFDVESTASIAPQLAGLGLAFSSTR